jgi:hypothetical protein
MPLKFSVLDGGFVQAAPSLIAFRVKGEIENPNLDRLSAPVYNSKSFPITSAILAINNGKIGEFKVEIRSTDLDGTNEVVHISDTLVLTFAGSQGWALTVDVSPIAANKVVDMYVQHITGGFTSDISVTLE